MPIPNNFITVLIFILQIFRSWAATSRLRPPMAFISRNSSDTQGPAPLECFILRAMRLSNKLLGQGYVKERLRSSLRKFYGRYRGLMKEYEVHLSRHSGWWPYTVTPSIDQELHQFLTLYCYGPYYRIWCFTSLREISIEHLQRVRHANRGRLLLRTPGPVPLWDLQVFLCRVQSLLNLSCFRTFLFRTSLVTSGFFFAHN